MTKQTVYHIIEWIIALAACAFLVWKIATYDDYASLWATLQAMSWPQWMAVVACVALMPVNMALEAWRWMTLMSESQEPKVESQEILSFREAHRQVYYSKLAGLITPWRLGEYPARGLLMEQTQISNVQSPMSNRDLWSRVLSMGVVGSATMTAAIVITGGVALLVQVLFYESLDAFVISYRYATVLMIVLLLLGLALYFSPRLLKRWATVSHKLVAISLGQSFLRLLCWCMQLLLVLWALGAIYNLQFTIYNLFVYYLLVTITPNVPIAEVGVRGTWAIAVFGSMNAALAGVLLWVINTLLPCLAWFFLRKK